MAVFCLQQIADLIQQSLRTLLFHSTVFTNRPLNVGTLNITFCVLISLEDSLNS